MTFETIAIGTCAVFGVGYLLALGRWLVRSEAEHARRRNTYEAQRRAQLESVVRFRSQRSPFTRDLDRAGRSESETSHRRVR